MVFAIVVLGYSLVLWSLCVSIFLGGGCCYTFSDAQGLHLALCSEITSRRLREHMEDWGLNLGQL